MISVRLEKIIDTTDDITVQGSSSNEDSALDELLKLNPAVVLIAGREPTSNSVDIIRRIKAALSGISVLLVTAAEDIETISLAMVAGANGCVSHESSAQQLLLAIRSVASGALWIDPSMVDLFMQRFVKLGSNGKRSSTPEARYPLAASAANDGHHPLSQRELQVLGLLSEGNSNKEIATKLSISSETVKLHVRSITRKLQASNRWQAVAIAIRDKLL